MKNDASNNNNNTAQESVTPIDNKKVTMVKEPDGIRCPLSLQIFKKPMLVYESQFSYEEDFLNEEMKKVPAKDPLTKQEIKITPVINRSLATIIESFLSEHPELKTEQYVIGSFSQQTPVEIAADRNFNQAVAQQNEENRTLWLTGRSIHGVDIEDDNSIQRNPSIPTQPEERTSSYNEIIRSLQTTNNNGQSASINDGITRIPTAALIIIGNKPFTDSFYKVCLISSNEFNQRYFIKTLLGEYPRRQRGIDFVIASTIPTSYQIWDIHPSEFWNADRTRLLFSSILRPHLKATQIVLFFGDSNEIKNWLKEFGPQLLLYDGATAELFSIMPQLTEQTSLISPVGRYSHANITEMLDINFNFRNPNREVINWSDERIQQFNKSLLDELRQAHKALVNERDIHFTLSYTPPSHHPDNDYVDKHCRLM